MTMTITILLVVIIIVLLLLYGKLFIFNKEELFPCKEETLPYTENLKEPTLKVLNSLVIEQKDICRKQQDYEYVDYKPRPLLEHTDNYSNYLKTLKLFDNFKNSEKGKLDLATNTAMKSLLALENMNEYDSSIPVIQVKGNITKVSFNKELTVCTLHCIRPGLILGYAGETFNVIKKELLKELEFFGVEEITIREDKMWDVYYL